MLGQTNSLLSCIAAILVGYLIGSLLPAYFIGRFRKVDIRTLGTKNPGTINVYNLFGIMPAVGTAIFDCLKGVAAIFIAQSLGANFVCMQIAGLAAIVGHVFPFYLRFQGGQGVGSATGIMLYYLIEYIVADVRFLYTIGFLLIIALLFYYVTHRAALVRMIVLPVLCYVVFATKPGFAYNPWLSVIVVHVVLIAVLNAARFRLIQIQDETFKSHWWRIALRPCAVIFVILYFYWPQRTLLVFVGSIALLFILIDVIRFVLRQANELLTMRIKNFLKKAELRRFSSMTMFLVAAFIVILVFKQDIAVAALTYLIFGDIFSKIYGLGFGRHHLFDKTVEGSVAYLGGVLICAYVLYTSLHIQPLMLVIGAIAATVAEFMPIGLDDNFTVGIVSGAVMTVVRTF